MASGLPYRPGIFNHKIRLGTDLQLGEGSWVILASPTIIPCSVPVAAIWATMSGLLVVAPLLLPPNQETSPLMDTITLTIIIAHLTLRKVIPRRTTRSITSTKALFLRRRLRGEPLSLQEHLIITVLLPITSIETDPHLHQAIIRTTMVQ